MGTKFIIEGSVVGILVMWVQKDHFESERGEGKSYIKIFKI